MKTVIDAVNRFKGAWPNSKNFVYIGTSINTNRTGKMQTTYDSINNTSWDLVCTREEFNQCVDEMATNYGTSETYADYKANYEMINDDMKTVIDWSKAPEWANKYGLLENECIYYNDEHYQYCRGDNNKYNIDENGVAGDIVHEDSKPVTTPVYTQEMHEAGEVALPGMEVNHFSKVMTVIAKPDADGYFPALKEKGTYTMVLATDCLPLTPPVVLDDGEAYLFTFTKTNFTGKGIYNSASKTFQLAMHQVNVYDCTNIQLLGVKS